MVILTGIKLNIAILVIGIVFAIMGIVIAVILVPPLLELQRINSAMENIQENNRYYAYDGSRNKVPIE